MFSPAIRKPHLLHRTKGGRVPFASSSCCSLPLPVAPWIRRPRPPGHRQPAPPGPWITSSVLTRSRRDELLGSLYDLAKQIVEGKYCIRKKMFSMIQNMHRANIQASCFVHQN